MSRKGISLPINMLVILAIAIVVLLALVSFFMGAFKGQSKGFKQQQANNMCCQKYVGAGRCGTDDDMKSSWNVTIKGKTYDCTNQPASDDPDAACCGNITG